MSKSAFCKGNPDESVPCYCEEYSAPTNISAGQKKLCAECLHGKSKHPQPQPPVMAELSAVTTAKEQLGVTAIYKQSLARQAGQSSQRTATRMAVRDEVMAGFCPPAKRKFQVSDLCDLCLRNDQYCLGQDCILETGQLFEASTSPNQSWCHCGLGQLPQCMLV